MALTKMAFNPTQGLRDTVAYPTTPVDEAAAREQIQGRLDEIKDFLNTTMTPEVDNIQAELTTHKAEKATDNVHGLAFKGIFLRKTANQSIANNANTVLSWAVADYDTNSFWSISEPTKITIPAGVSKVKLTAQVRWAGTSGVGERYIRIKKNGFEFIGVPVGRMTASSNSEINITSPVLSVAPGNYFEVDVKQTSGGALDVEYYAPTWFNLEVVE